MTNARLVSLALTALLVPLSGCIAADDFYNEMEDEWDDMGEEMEEEYEDWHAHGSSHSHEDDSWGDDCEEEDNATDQEDAVEVRPSKIEAAYTDADPRYSNYVDGDEDSRRTIHIPLGTDHVRVGFVHHLHGEIEVRLRDPLGFTKAVEEFQGSKEMEEDQWYQAERPLAGDWTLDIELDGAYGGYTIGFYIDD